MCDLCGCTNTAACECTALCVCVCVRGVYMCGVCTAVCVCVCAWCIHVWCVCVWHVHSCVTIVATCVGRHTYVCKYVCMCMSWLEERCWNAPCPHCTGCVLACTLRMCVDHACAVCEASLAPLLLCVLLLYCNGGCLCRRGG